MGGDGDEEGITLLFFYCANENPVIEREGPERLSNSVNS